MSESATILKFGSTSVPDTVAFQRVAGLLGARHRLITVATRGWDQARVQEAVLRLQEAFFEGERADLSATAAAGELAP